MILQIDPSDMPGLKARLVEGPPRSIHWDNLLDMDEHFRHMRQDFVGQPELCHVHGKLIALIRRRINLAHHVPTFFALWSAEAEFLIDRLNSRWLLSACDTISGHGEGVQRSNAAVVSTLFHTIQLCETERLALRDSSYNPEKYSAALATHAAGTHIPLWDGIKADNFEYGDTGRVMLTYVMNVLDLDPLVGPIGRALIARALADDTLLGRLARRNPRFLPPSLSGTVPDKLVPNLSGSINGHNIVLYEEKFFVVPISLGPVDLTQPEERKRPGIAVTGTILEAVRVARLGQP